MIVAMVSVRVVKTTVDKVVDMIAMRHRFMATSGAVLVACAVDIWRAAGGVLFADRNDMFFYLVADLMLKVTIAEIVYVASVTDGQVAAAWAVTMGGIWGNRHFLVLLFDQYSH